MKQVIEGELTPESASRLLRGSPNDEVVAKFQKVVQDRPLWAVDCLLEHCRRDTPDNVRLNAWRVLASLENIPKAFSDKAQDRIFDGITRADSEELHLVLLAATNLARNQDTRILRLPDRDRTANALNSRFDSIDTDADRAIAARCLYYLGKTGQELLLNRFVEAPGGNSLKLVSVALKEESPAVIGDRERPFAQLACAPLMNYLGLCSKALVASKRNDPETDVILVRCCAELGPLAADQIVKSLAVRPGKSPLEERVLPLMLGDGVGALQKFFSSEAKSEAHSDKGVNNILKVSEKILGNLISLGTVHDAPRFFVALANFSASHAAFGREPAISRVLHVSMSAFSELAKAHPANEDGQPPFLFDHHELVDAVRHCVAGAVSRYVVDCVGERQGSTRAKPHPGWLAEMVDTAKSTFPRDSEGARVADKLLKVIKGSNPSHTIHDFQEFLFELNAPRGFLRM